MGARADGAHCPVGGSGPRTEARACLRGVLVWSVDLAQNGGL